MAKVVNLNRFRKRRAREEKEKQAERNRRLHGRTKAERADEAAQKKRLEKKLEGAFLVRERVPVQGMEGTAEEALSSLERATRQVLTLSEYAERLRRSAVASDAEEATAGDDDVPIPAEGSLERSEPDDSD